MTHFLKEITIRNFRSIKEETFVLRPFTVLIGYNNAGKTNVLLAIKWLLRRSGLDESYFNKPDEPLEVEGVISGIDELLIGKLPPNQRKGVEPYVKNGELRIKRFFKEPSTRASDSKLFVWNPDFKNGKEVWKSNPTGLDEALGVLFPEPIFIGAMENAEEDIGKAKAGTTIGKLLAEITEPLQEKHGEGINRALGPLKNLFDADSLQRAPELSKADRLINRNLNGFFPGVSVKVHIPAPGIKDIFKAGTLKVYEEGRDTGMDIDSLGSGAQRSIQMALIRHLAEVKNEVEHSGTCTLLLVDEPELYLHPQAIEQVRIALQQLSREGYQVICSTHSPLIVDNKEVASAILVRKDPKKGTLRRPTLKEAVEKVEKNHTHQFEQLFRLGNSSRVLFCEGILLTEGKTEGKVFPQLFERVAGAPLGKYNVGLLHLDGSGNLLKSMAILKAMGIPCKAIADLDFIFKIACWDDKLGLQNDQRIQDCRSYFKALEEQGQVKLDEKGNPKKKGSKIKPSGAFEEMAKQENLKPLIKGLHDHLLLHDIWVWPQGTIETHIGIQGKDDKAWSEFIKSLEVADFKLPDQEGAKRLVRWIIEK